MGTFKTASVMKMTKVITSERFDDKRIFAFNGLVTAMTRSSRSAKMIMLPLCEDAIITYELALQNDELILMTDPYSTNICNPLVNNTSMSATARAPMYTLQLTERFCFCETTSRHKMLPTTPTATMTAVHQKRVLRIISR